MRLVFICCLALTIAACGETNQHLAVASQSASAVVAAQSKAKNITAAEIFAAFKKDISVCESAAKTLKMDTAFIDSYSDAFRRESKSLESFLREAGSAKSGDIQYILANLKYFQMNVCFDDCDSVVARVENEGIFCDVSQQRLADIESLGESSQAWEVREFFLSKNLTDLRSPSDDMGFYETQYDSFNQFVTDTSKRYIAQRPQFLAWVKKAIEHLELQRKGIEEGGAGQTLVEQNKILDKEISFLKLFEQATHDVRLIRFEKTFLSCSDVGNGIISTNTQFNMFFVAHPVLYHLGYKDKGGGVGWINLPKDIESSVKSGVLDQAKHGKVELRDERNERTHEYFYLPNSDGYVGKDRVAFWVEVQGRRYKVVYNLAVIEDEDPENSPQCERMKF